MDMYNKVLLYTAVLRPIISYGCPVWGYAAKTNINILESTANYLGFLLRLSRHPPPTPCHHVIYVPPASQSGSFMLPIKDYSTTPGNTHYSCYGTEERSAFHVPINHTQKIHKRDDYPPIVGRLCDQEDHEERGSKDRAASTCGPHSDSFNDTSRRRRSNCPETISRHLAEANLKSKRRFCALHLTPEHRPLLLQWCQARLMWNVTDWHRVAACIAAGGGPTRY
ncbi:hypothetical protein TNCV_2790351 [Trichonephila clavipes]|nr:hypothetical protein TNCV_2790351 [Trichonephila clavipes]